MNTENDYFADLQSDDLDAVKTTTSDSVKTFPCERCDGTGIATWGYRYTYKGKCKLCQGRGHFKTSKHDRLKAKASRARSAEKKEAETLTAGDKWRKDHPGVISFLAENQWSDFYASLYNYFGKKGCLTEGQLAAVKKAKGKAEKKHAEKAKALTVELDLGVIFEKFENAKGAGLKKPRLNVGRFNFSLAPDNGKNAGWIYVKADGVYIGKVQDAFIKGRDCTDKDVEELKVIAEDPLAAAVAHGRLTGTCSCCGRELHNEESIKLGIGPVCLTKWGL